MSVPYHRPLRGIAYRSGALRGSVPAGVDISYGALPLTVTDFRGGPSLEMCKDALQMAEEQLAQAIAETGNHPFRRVLLSQTANIAHGALIPATDADSKPVIGIRGSIVDATDGTVLTEQPLEVVRRMVRNSNSWRKCPVYYYKIDDNRLYHTRTNTKIDVCTYDAATQRTAIDANSDMLLPDTLEDALVSGGVAILGGDSVSFNNALNAVRGGITIVSPKSINPTEVAA